MLLFFVYTGLELTAGQWLYTLLTEARGIVPVVAGVWISVYWGSLTAGQLLSGVIVAYISVRTLLQLCMVGAILGVVLFWLKLAPWLAVGGVALLGVSLAPMFPSRIALTPAHGCGAHGKHGGLADDGGRVGWGCAGTRRWLPRASRGARSPRTAFAGGGGPLDHGVWGVGALHASINGASLAGSLCAAEGMPKRTRQRGAPTEPTRR